MNGHTSTSKKSGTRKSLKEISLNNKQKTRKFLPFVIMICGIIGLLASFMLAVETIEYIKDPSAPLACNINPIVSCSSVIDTPQGQILGFMNPLIGVVGFSMLIVFGLAVLYKAKFPKWVWMAAQATSLLTIALIHWLIYNSVYVLGSLCPYCMVVWVISMPIALHITIRNVNEGLLGEKAKSLAAFLNEYHYTLLLIWYAAVVALIINHFSLSSLLA